MADAEKAILKKLGTLLVELRALHAKAEAIEVEMDALLGGGPGVGVIMKQLENHFGALWAARYGSAYLWAPTKDRPTMKRLLRALPVDEITERMARYLRDHDPFFVKVRHSFGLFASTINQHTKPVVVKTIPVGCWHDPPCWDDAAHTSRRQAEIRQ